MSELKQRVIAEGKISLDGYRTRLFPAETRSVWTETDEGRVERFVRNFSVQVMVTDQHLTDLRIKLGSPEFLSGFIDPMIYMIFEEAKLHALETSNGPLIICGAFPDKVQPTAPYHWYTVAEVGGLPVLILTYILDGTLYFQFHIRVATLEKFS